MNVLITLPKYLIDAIISGQKRYEMRVTKPLQMKLGEDGFFCVEKGSDVVRCWCRCDRIQKAYTKHNPFAGWDGLLCVSRLYIDEYVRNKEYVYMWHIDKVIVFEDGSLYRDSLIVDRNPRQFAYCPLSHGESY